MKIAIIIGATGLVGSHLTHQLLENKKYQKVKIFVRRSPNITHKKLITHVVNFDDLQFWKKHLTGDELYSVLGTTLKKAGSQNAQYKVDYDYQYNVASAARENGVKKLLLVSSAGANADSKNFYLRMKGKLDNAVKGLDFPGICIFKPSILIGKRTELRIMEKIAVFFTRIFTTIIPFLRKYRPVHGKTVAAAMITAANLAIDERVLEIESNKIFWYANKKS